MDQAQKNTNGTVPVNFVSTPGYGVVDDYLKGDILEEPINGLNGDDGNLEVPEKVEGVLDNGGGIDRQRIYRGPEVSQGLELNSGNGSNGSKAVEVAGNISEVVGGDSNISVEGDMENQVGDDTDSVLDLTGEGVDTVITEGDIMKEPTNKEMQVKENNPDSNQAGVGIEKLETEIQNSKNELRELERALQEKQEEVAKVMKGVEVLGVNEESVTVLEQELKDAQTAVEDKKTELQKAVDELELKEKNLPEVNNVERGEISESKKSVEVIIADSGLLGAISEGITRLGLNEDNIAQISDEAFSNFTKETLNELVNEGMNREEAVEAFRAMMKSWAVNKTAISVELLNNKGEIKVSIAEGSKPANNPVDNNEVNPGLNNGVADDYYDNLQKAA